MSGALAMMGKQLEQTITVTVADASPVDFGFSITSSPGGAVSPSSFVGESFREINSRSLPTPFDLFITIGTTSLPQTFFKAVRVVTTAGAIRIYLSSAATYSLSGGSATWSWGSGSSPVWTAAGTKTITFIK